MQNILSYGLTILYTQLLNVIHLSCLVLAISNNPAVNVLFLSLVKDKFREIKLLYWKTCTFKILIADSKLLSEKDVPIYTPT